MQPRYNILFRHIEAELLPLAADQGIGVIAYNPLAGGVLTGRYHAGQLYQARYWHEAQLKAVEHLKQLCNECHLLIAQVAIAWVLENPTITSAIVGASKPEQLDQTLPAVDLKLDEQLREACNAIWYQLPHESNSEIAYR